MRLLMGPKQSSNPAKPASGQAHAQLLNLVGDGGSAQTHPPATLT